MRLSSYGKYFIVIIDNMCNLNLLYIGPYLSRDLRLSTIATTHAGTTLKNHFREDWSPYHVVVYGEKRESLHPKVQHKDTLMNHLRQEVRLGGILGYAETYFFMKNQKFLDVAKYNRVLFVSITKGRCSTMGFPCT